MDEQQHEGDPGALAAPTPASPAEPRIAPQSAREIGGPSGLEPTRYGDWERNGRCYDF